MIVDLFAGPGGWDVGCQLARLPAPVGLEWDKGACNTRRAAGHLTVRADVATYPPEAFAGATGLIASPPCQEFSTANARKGGLDTARGGLVNEVMRWARAIRPEWIACEQVPPVLPIWRQFAHQLCELGYDATARVLCAADYGVPQKRHRAILIAHRDGPARWPAVTHTETASLFGDPWESMADSLGWGHGNVTARHDGGFRDRHSPNPHLVSWDRPAPTVISSHAHSSDWVDVTPAKWSGGRGERDDRTPRLTASGGSSDEPAPTIRRNHAKASEWRPVGDTGRVGPNLAELGVLQGFPPDYPWTGPGIGQQIGNAIPPPFAAAILSALTSEARR